MSPMRDMEAIAAAVVQGLARATTRGDLSIITTPVLAYGHTFVTVHLTFTGNGLLVSDGGFVKREVSMMGGDPYLAANAKRVAARYGIRFDGDLFFSIEGHDEVSAVAAAVAAVANAAKDTIETVAERLADRSDDGARDHLVGILRSAFGRNRVTTGHRARLAGAQEEWEFDAVVQASQSQLAVLIVSPHTNSVTTAFSKFSDIRRNSEAKNRGYAVLTDLDHTPRLRLISDVATLLPIQRSTTEYWGRTAQAA